MRSHIVDRAPRNAGRKVVLLGALAPLLVVGALAASLRADAAAPSGRYTVAAGGMTVYDSKTKLTWQRAPAAATYVRYQAINYCTSAEVATALGGTGWRLPTKKELLTLVDYSVAIPGPTIDAAAFPGTPTSEFWSATPVASTTNTGWGVSFDSGATATLGNGDAVYVRCVR